MGIHGLQKITNYSVLRRFTKCQSTLNPFVKIALHSSKAPSGIYFIDSHCLMSNGNIFSGIVNVSKKHFKIKDDVNCEDLEECMNIAWIAHFKAKTYEEFVKRIQRNVGYWSKSIDGTYSKFIQANHNEVEDRSALRFMETRFFK